MKILFDIFVLKCDLLFSAGNENLHLCENRQQTSFSGPLPPWHGEELLHLQEKRGVRCPLRDFWRFSARRN